MNNIIIRLHRPKQTRFRDGWMGLTVHTNMSCHFIHSILVASKNYRHCCVCVCVCLFVCLLFSDRPVCSNFVITL